MSISENTREDLIDNVKNMEKLLGDKKKNTSSTKIPSPHNRIIFGAPGTGKSYQLNNDRKEYFDESHFERVTFHPNYSYAQFVGTYKPTMKKIEKETKEEITYEYVPGPFIRVLENALKNPNENYLLLIEEINRANVAAVFGDAFQLLDRNSDNESEYKIATSEDLKKYLISKEIDEDSAANLYLPSNMYIWATMNSADQGVQPLDTAFKRRWDFEYLPINGDEKATVDNKPLEDYLNEAFIPTPPMAENKYKLESWNKIRKAINKKLKNIGINEDKLLGPFFISKSKLDEVNKIKDTPQNEGNALFIAHFKSKVLMYLFEDAAKMHHSSVFDESNGKKHFSDICSDFDTKGIEIFSSDIVNEIRNDSKTSQGE